MKSLQACCLVACAAAVIASTRESAAITRDEVIATARAFVYHPWRCETKNLTASCSSTYESFYVPGDYLGLPYDWGGYMNLFQFDQQISSGYGAGSPYNGDILDCTAGVDCSGFASQCLHVSYHTTSMLPDITQAIAKPDLLAGDIVNKAGYHVVVFSHLLGSGEPYLYESSPPNTRVNATGGWSYLSGYTPRRYTEVTGASAGNPVGTLDNPIQIGSFPYTDSRDTKTSSSDVIDGCALAPGTSESGPEYVYQATFSQPGSLTVSVSDDVGVDIDVHLYGSANTSDCLARHDTSFTKAVDCGTYLIVADTFAGSSESPGAYTLNVTFTPSGGSCGSGPPAYAPKGKLGDTCSKAFPYCNMTLDGEVCVLTTPESKSFCSKACKADSDCAELSGGCCEELGAPGSGEYYCLKAEFCSGSSPDAGTGGPAGAPGAGGSGGDASGGSPGQGGSAQGGSAQGGSAQGGESQGGAPSDGGSSGQSLEDAGIPTEPASEDAGCGCRTAGAAPGFGPAMAIAAIGLLLRRKRRTQDVLT